MAICAATVISGFFFAARQHFSSMDYGMKNSRLRRQIDELEAEKRRLVLSREVSLSPAEIKRAAKKVGLLGGEQNPAVAQVISSTKEKAVPATPSTPEKGLIIKTAAVAPAQQPIAEKLVGKTARLEKPAKSASTTN
jgi:hypothetical protein